MTWTPVVPQLKALYRRKLGGGVIELLVPLDRHPPSMWRLAFHRHLQEAGLGLGTVVDDYLKFALQPEGDPAAFLAGLQEVIAKANAATKDYYERLKTITEGADQKADAWLQGLADATDAL